MIKDGDKRVAAALDAVAKPTLSTEARLNACHTLVKFGYVDQASPVLADLMSDPAIGGRARLLQRTAEYLVRRGVANALTSLDGAGDSCRPMIAEHASTAYWRCPDPQQASENLVIVFTGVGRDMWISLDLMHRILRQSVGQALYLRDFRTIYYLAGIESWGDYDATLERMRRIVRDAAARKLFMIGGSAGGFGALKYGIDLSADAILALSPITDLRKLRWRWSEGRRLRRFGIPARALDLASAYAQASRRPHVTIVYGAGNKRDKAYAERLAPFPEVELMALPDVEQHDTMTYLLSTGKFDGLLRQLLAR